MEGTLPRYITSIAPPNCWWNFTHVRKIIWTNIVSTDQIIFKDLGIYVGIHINIHMYIITIKENCHEAER